MNDGRHEDETPTYRPREIEVAQLTADVAAVLGTLLTYEGAAADRLYGRGVRSKLDGEPIPSYEGPRAGAQPALLRDFVGAWVLVRTDPDSGYPGVEAYGKLEPRPDGVGVVLFPQARVVLNGQQMSEVPGHIDVALEMPVMSPGPGQGAAVPQPIPERKLPQGVYNVIHFVQLLDLGAAGAGNPDWRTRISDGRGGDRQLTTADLKAVLAEIPDVAPRYPTIWAYEQACRTIRERDDRIEKALTLAEQEIPGPAAGEADAVLAEVARTLRLRMPRTEPATPEQLSEVARALELVEQEPGSASWGETHAAAKILAGEVEHLRTLGATLHADLMTVAVADTGELEQCGTCSAQEPPVKRIAVGRSGRGWPRCAQHLVEDALDDAGLEKTVKRCSSCSHLASAHYKDGSGCNVTIRDVIDGHDNHCPCTFDARAEAWGANNA